MALPTTLSGLKTPPTAPVLGPFQSSGGNYYVIGRDSTNANFFLALKASDPTSSFSSAGTFGSTNVPYSYDSAFQSGNVIYIVSSGSPVYFTTFTMDTDTWSTPVSVATTTNPSSNTQVGIVVRSTGEIVVAYPGNYNAIMGTHYSTVYYATSTNSGSTWGTPVEIDAGGATNWQGVVAILGASDTVHFLWGNGTSTVYQRALNSSNVMQTQGSSATGGSLTNGVAYNNSGTTKVIVQFGGGAQVLYFDSSATPTLNMAATQSTAYVPARVMNDGTNAWIIGTKNGSPYTLAVTESTDNGATWGSTTATGDTLSSATEAYLSLNANVYTRGSSVVVPFVCYNSLSKLVYDEYLIRTVSVSHVGTITSTSTLTGVGVALKRTAATITATSAISGIGLGLKITAGTVTATSAVSGVGRGLGIGTGTISSTSAIAAKGASTNSQKATITATSALSGAGVAYKRTVATITATSVLTGGGVAYKRTSATVTSTSALSGVGRQLRLGTSTVTATSSLTGVGVGYKITAATITATSGLSGVSSGASTGAGTVHATSSLTGVGVQLRIATATIAATSSLLGVSSNVPPGGTTVQTISRRGYVPGVPMGFIDVS